VKSVSFYLEQGKKKGKARGGGGRGGEAMEGEGKPPPNI